MQGRFVLQLIIYGLLTLLITKQKVWVTLSTLIIWALFQFYLCSFSCNTLHPNFSINSSGSNCQSLLEILTGKGLMTSTWPYIHHDMWYPPVVPYHHIMASSTSLTCHMPLLANGLVDQSPTWAFQIMLNLTQAWDWLARSLGSLATTPSKSDPLMLMLAINLLNCQARQQPHQVRSSSWRQFHYYLGWEQSLWITLETIRGLGLEARIQGLFWCSPSFLLNVSGSVKQVLVSNMNIISSYKLVFLRLHCVSFHHSISLSSLHLFSLFVSCFSLFSLSSPLSSIPLLPPPLPPLATSSIPLSFIL